jgi:hypothetical protein
VRELSQAMIGLQTCLFPCVWLAVLIRDAEYSRILIFIFDLQQDILAF